MPTYTFKARTSHGEVISGTQDAPTENDAVQKLRDQGYWVTELHLKRGDPRSPSAELSTGATKDVPIEDFLFGEAHPKDLALFFRQMAASFHAGIGIARCIELSAIGAGPRLKRALAQVVPQLEQGRSLSEALAPRRELIGRAAWALIRAGETSGGLEDVFHSLAGHFERRWKLQMLVRRASVYPVILLLAFIFIPLLPVAVIQGPMEAAKSLLSTASSLALLVFGYFAFKVVTRFEIPGMLWDTLLFHLPGIGPFVRKSAAARFARTLADLYNAGVGPLSALGIAADTCGNRFVGRNLLRAGPALEEGQPLAESLAQTRALPVIAIQMLVTGETSGSVGDVLNKVADYLEGEVETGTEMFMKALPVLLWVAIALPTVLSILRFWGGFYGSQ